MRIEWIQITIVLLAGLSNGCTGDLDIDVPEPDDKIVVDGWIEQGRQARVLLTANSPYFSVIDSSSFRDLVLTRARVSLSDGEQTENLILRKDTNYFPPYYYQGNRIIGTTGNIYTLTAEYGGKTASARTTIPEPVPLDTTYFRPADGHDSLGIIYLEFTDPPEAKNHYRIFTKREGIDHKFIPANVMALDDQHFTGKRAEFSLYRQSDNYLEAAMNNYFSLGDTVIVKLCTMDRESYEFWKTLQDEIMNAHNPFAASLSEIRSNIRGDGLGIWSGYGVSMDTVYTGKK